MTTKLYNACAALALAIAAIAPIPAQAARVTPMIVDIDEFGRGAVTRIDVTNTDDRELPVELRVFRGIISERGELTLEEADEDFLIFPPQTVIAAERQQTFRVQYLGEQPLDRSAVYYISIREVPVPLVPGTSRIQLLTHFNVLVNVVPEGSEAIVQVASMVPAVREEAPGIEVRVENLGTKYFAAGRSAWTIAGSYENGENFSLDLTPDEVGKYTGYGLVPPGQARIFFIPTASAPSAEGLQATIGD